MSFIDLVRDHPRRIFLALLLAVVAGIFLVDALIETDAEKIEALLAHGRDRFMAGDADGVEGCLDQDFTSSFITRPQIRKEVTSRPFAEGYVSMGDLRIEPNDPTRASARVKITVRREPEPIQSILMRMSFVKRGDTWRILGVELGI